MEQYPFYQLIQSRNNLLTLLISLREERKKERQKERKKERKKKRKKAIEGNKYPKSFKFFLFIADREDY